MRPSPAVCAAVQPEPALPDDAGLVAPVTAEEKAATAAFLNWVAQLGDWGRTLATRADHARAGCA